MDFAFEAMTAEGQVVTDRIEAGTLSEAAEALRARGLLVLRLNAVEQAEPRRRTPLLRWPLRRIRPGELVLFTRQLKMLLEAGAALVPALEAIERQTTRPAFAALVRAVREHVEEGGTLADAFRARPDVFDPVFCSMVAAGEATATLPATFDRLNEMTGRQHQTRKAVIGALAYPCVLSLLCVAVACVVVGFVVPRFAALFKNLNSPLPPVTRFLFAASEDALRYWPLLAGAVGLAVGGLLLVVRIPALRLHLDRLLLELPLIGRVVRRLIFARVLRIWAAMLRCHVPLLEAIAHSRTALTNAVFLRLVRDVEEGVAAGGMMGRALAESPLVEPVVASAIRTGEDNGRLAEAVDFVSRWMDSDNAQIVAGLARIAEPALLTVMGLFVGLVAMSLFIPLFDLATAGA